MIRSVKRCRRKGLRCGEGWVKVSPNSLSRRKIVHSLGSFVLSQHSTRRGPPGETIYHAVVSCPRRVTLKRSIRGISGIVSILVVFAIVSSLPLADGPRLLGGSGGRPHRRAGHALVPRGRHFPHHDAPPLRPARECDDLVLVHPAIRTRRGPERLGGLCRARRAELHLHRVLPDDDVAQRNGPLVDVASRRPVPRERHRRSGYVLLLQAQSDPRELPRDSERPLRRRQ